MAGRGGEADAEASEVEIDVARGVELHLDRGVASGRHFTQLQCFAEEAADLGADLFFVEGDTPVAGPYDERFPHRRSDAVVVRETDVVRGASGAFAAEEAASQVECKGRGRKGPGGADRRGLLHRRALFGRCGLGQFGPPAESRRQLHGVEILDGLLSVASQNAYFRKNHNRSVFVFRLLPAVCVINRARSRRG